MITVRYDLNEYLLDIGGHAEYAPHGQDIVCAAVSALSQTLAAWLLDYAPCMEGAPEIEAGEGRLHIQCSPRSVWRCEVLLLYQFVIKGLRQIAGEYPQHVQIMDGCGGITKQLL